MWTYDTHFNVTDLTSSTLEVFADSGEAYVQVWLLGSKVGAYTPPTLWTTLHAPAYNLAQTPLPVSASPAFTGGYGAVRLISVAGPTSPANIFGAHIVDANPLSWSAISGATFSGTDFTCPLTPAPVRTTQSIHVVTTLLSTATQAWDVTVSQAGSGWTVTQNVSPGMTWRWQSDVAGVSVDASQNVRIHCNSNCVASFWKINAGVSSRVYLPAATVG